MTKKNTGTTTLLPLEYCRIGRAARLLGCEIEDIIHWASLGMIEACVFLSGEEVTPTFYRDGLKPLEDREGRNPLSVDWDANPMEAHEELFKINSFTYPQIGLYSESTRFWDEGVVYASGPWAISTMAVADIIAGEPRQLAGEWLWPAGNNKPKSLSIGVRVKQAEGVLIDECQIWIVRDDLVRLANAIDKGKRLSVLPHLPQRKLAEAAASTPSSKPHGNAERNAAKRENVLAAGLCALKTWPDELRVAVGREVGGQAIAELVSIHEAILFDGGEAPLSTGTMTQIFNEALGRAKLPKIT